MKWENNDQNDSRVVTYTSWRFIENYQNLQDRAGVYVFANSDHQVKYIGKAGAGRTVAEIYSALNRNKDFGATLVKSLYTNSSSRALSLERELINKYNPPNNFI